MNDLYIVAAGVAASFLTSLVKKEHWSTQVKQSVAVILSLITGGVASYVQAKGIDATKLIVSWAGSLGVSQAVFVYGLQKTGLDKILAAVGSKPFTPDTSAQG